MIPPELRASQGRLPAHPQEGLQKKMLPQEGFSSFCLGAAAAGKEELEGAVSPTCRSPPAQLQPISGRGCTETAVGRNSVILPFYGRRRSH